MEESADQNTSDVQPENQAEFAEKQPLIAPKKLKRIIAGSIAIIMLIMIIVIAFNIIREIINRPPVIAPPPIIDQPEIVKEKEDVPILAYIKDKRNIWTVDINGENKERIIELSPSSANAFSEIFWKNENELTYVKCSNESFSNCGIATITIEDKSIESVIENTGDVTGHAWSSNQLYLAYSTKVGEKINLRLKSGTIDTVLESFLAGNDLSRTKSKVLFTPDNQYAIFSAPKKDLVKIGRKTEEVFYPIISVYRINGVKVDEIRDATDPMIIDEDTIIYKKNGQLMKRDIGTSDEAAFTLMDGYNSEISPDKSQIAYWRTEGNLNNIILGVFDSDLDIHRNILRGVLLPKWLTDNKVVGIKADNCAGTNCQLYEFRTNSLVIVDIKGGNVTSVDQGKKITGVTFYEKPLDSLE